MMTRNGVCYVLPMSPYKCTLYGMTFYFSSENHQDKFLSELDEHIAKINESLSARFKLTVNAAELAAVLFYKKVETRGFYISADKGCATCLDEVEFSGQISNLTYLEGM